MLDDKTNFGVVLYNPTNFYRFEETSSYWSVKRISVFLCFSLVNECHTSAITVYNRRVTNIENTAKAMHSCNSWLYAFNQRLYNYTVKNSFKSREHIKNKEHGPYFEVSAT